MAIGKFDLSDEETERQLAVARAELEVAREHRKAVERELPQVKRDLAAALGERIATEKQQVDTVVGPLAVTCEPIVPPTAINRETEPLAPNDELVLPAGGVLPEKACVPELSACGPDDPTGVDAEMALEDEVGERGPREPLAESAAALNACLFPADLPSAEVAQGSRRPGLRAKHGVPSADTGHAGSRHSDDPPPFEKSP